MAGRTSNTLSVGALKPIDGLPDPKGSLSTTIPSAAIALAILTSVAKPGPTRAWARASASSLIFNMHDTRLGQGAGGGGVWK